MKYFGMVALVTATLATAADQKVVVIGFDGADHRIVQDMLAAGELPNLEALKNRGGFSALTPTNPPQTPVSWSTFATGINPGRTGIFDFIKRKQGSYVPNFALQGETSKTVLLGARNKVVFPIVGFLLIFAIFFFLFRKAHALVKWGSALVLGGLALWGCFFVFANWIPNTVPAAFTVRQGKPLWKILEEKGKSATVIRLPVTFPAEPLKGEMVSGLAVPDIRGTVGKPSIYSNDPNWEVKDNQFSIEVKRLIGDAPYQTTILGPPNKLFYDSQAKQKARLEGRPYTVPKDFELDLTIEVGSDKVTPIVAGNSYPLSPKEWSPWVEFDYKVNPIITLKGAGRFYLDYLQDGFFKLYMTPVHLHPDMPLPLTYPQNLAKKIWKQEPYKTMGWALDTWSVGNSLMDEEHFLDDVDLTVTRYEKMMEDFLKDNQSDLFVQIFSFTDRVGHVLWHYWDEGHPTYDPVKGPKYQEALRETYRRMDRIVGRAMGLVDLDKTAFIVCSDHGFASWRYQFSLNTWLVQNGYMKLKKNVLGVPMKLDDLQTSTTPFNFVEWAETKAYALGLGMVFINLEGREPEGSVKADEYDALCRQLSADLEAFVDEKTGINPVRKVYLRDEIYNDYDAGVTPDLRVANTPLYRVSWDTTLGGMPAEMTEINSRNWSGDHCSLDPRDVQGILFSSIPIKSADPQMADMCPSILSLLGVTHDIRMDGVSVF